MAQEAEKQPGEEGTVDHDGYKNFIQGQAATADGETPPAEQPKESPDDIVEVSIKGKKVKMTREAANEYAAFVRETRERDGRLGGEIAQLRERSARLEGMVEARTAESRTDKSEIKPPDPELATTDFAEWQRRWTAYHEAKLEEQRAGLEEKYETDQRERATASAKETAERLWGERFYRAHPHLNKPRIRKIVFDVYRENARDINACTTETEQYDRLAELADAAIIEINEDTKPQHTTTNKPLHLEGGGTPAHTRRETPARPEPVTAASWSQKKRAAIRGGR